jgi:Amt family ammonium transporter
MVGTFATGLFAATAVNAAGPNGLLFGNPAQLVSQMVGIIIVATFAFAGSYVLLRFINVFSPLRVGSRDEDAGLDISQHGEKAYE